MPDTQLLYLKSGGEPQIINLVKLLSVVQIPSNSPYFSYSNPWSSGLCFISWMSWVYPHQNRLCSIRTTVETLRITELAVSLSLWTPTVTPNAPTSVTKICNKMQGCGMWRDRDGENCYFISSRLSMRRQAAYRVTGCRVLNRLIQNINFPSGETNSEHPTQKSGRDSVVGIATRYYWLKSPRFECRRRRNIPAPRTTQPPERWLPDLLSRGLSGRGAALTTHLLLGPKLKKE
jgi:hypothetical protein